MIDIIDDEDSWRNVRRRNKKFSFRWISKTEFAILSDPTPDGDGAGVADFPAMPVCLDGQEQHRDKLTKPMHMSEEDVHDAVVARPVGKKELLANPKAQASLDVEWEKLMKKKAWDILSVRDWEDVSREAKKKNKKVHVGKVFEICVEKGSELPANDPLRKFKGRAVFQGNNVKDEAVKLLYFANWDQALPPWKLAVLTPMAMHLATRANRQTASRRIPKPLLRVPKPGSGCPKIVGPRSGTASSRTQSVDCTLPYMDTPTAGGSGSSTVRRCLAK